VTQQLHIASFNAENFYLLLDGDYSREELDALDEASYLAMNSSIYNPNKDRSKIAEIARIIIENNFDLIGMCEVGGLQTLDAFNRIYLENRYDCYLFEENSTRGIFVGALLKKGRFPGARVRNMSGSFSRNLLKLELGKKGGSLEDFALHLKSQRGDFNGILIRGMHQFEFERFLELPFYDVLAAVGIPPAARHTHYYFGGGKHFSQLDYIFCTHDIDVLNAGVIEDAVPQNRDERNRLPSDHIFIRAKIEIGN